MERRRVTVTDVAVHARVSRQTVSNALNRPEIVRPATLARVRQAITELGYRPMPAARQLRSGRARTIAFALPVVPRSAMGVADRFLHALTAAAQRREHRVLLFAAGSDIDDIGQYEQLLADSAVDAFVLADTHHGDTRPAWLTERGARFATFGRPWDARPDVDYDWVDVDGAAGTEAAVERLAALGHRQIGFIGWPTGSGAGDDRRAGWERALRARGLAADGLSREVVDSPANGAEAARSLIVDGVTALVCSSDTLALGAWSEAGAAGVAVVGFDDTAVAEAVGLSSTAQPLREAADLVVQVLLDGESRTPRGTLLTPTLIERASSAPRPT